MDNTPEITNILKSIKNLIHSEVENEEILELTELAESDEESVNKKVRTSSSYDAFDASIVTQGLKSQETNSHNIKSDIKRLLEVNDQINSNINTHKSLKLSPLEEAVVELIKPQLNEWLNKNLSKIVNQVVEKEISRLLTKNEI